MNYIYRMNTIFCLNIISDKSPPSEFLLFKFGENPTYHIGGQEETIHFSEMDAYRFLANNHNKKVMIDYDHGSLMEYSPNPAETSKAAGFGVLRLKDDGLYLCDIEWTAPAAEKLKNGEFLYVSPAYETKDGEMERFINVALTNMPALINNAEILNNRGKTMADEKEIVELKAQLKAMELAMKAKDQALEAVEAQKQEVEVAGMVDEAIEAGKLGKAERAEYVQFGADYGVARLSGLLGKLKAKLPTKLNVVEKQEVEAPAEEVEELSKTKQAILRYLSAPGVDVGPIIKNADDKAKYLNKLADPKKTIESSRFFNGWGFRGLGGIKK